MDKKRLGLYQMLQGVKLGWSGSQLRCRKLKRLSIVLLIKQTIPLCSSVEDGSLLSLAPNGEGKLPER